MKNEKINVYGMTCEHCVNTVTKAISALSGVNSVNVNLKGEYAAVSYDEQVVKTDDIKKAVKEAGYETEKAKHGHGHGHGGMKEDGGCCC